MVRSAAALEVLDGAFPLFGLFAGFEGSKVAGFPGLWIFLARIEAEFSGFEFANHKVCPFYRFGSDIAWMQGSRLMSASRSCVRLKQLVASRGSLDFAACA